MMDTRYHVLFAGELQEGHAMADVRAKIAKLFNANEATLEKLFSGQPQAIKRDCDRATAAKYKAAIEKAGAKPIIKVAETAAQAEPAEQSVEPGPTPRADRQDAEPQPGAKSPPAGKTAAEKIAALAAAADSQPDYSQPDSSQPDYDGNDQVQGNNQTRQAEAEPAAAAEAAGDDALLAPTGSDVLRPEERQQPEAAEVDTTGLELDAPTDRLAPEAAPAPAAPDTSHLDMGEVGDTIPTLEREETALDPNTDGISLAPEGGDLSDCAPAAAAEPTLDLSGMNLAPTGSDVLEEQYRRQESAAAPDTDHLSLDD